jgi:hypothetical protein
MTDFYVYAHYKPDGTVFYIGKGRKYRAWAKDRRSDSWNNTVKKHGYTVKLWAENLSEQHALDMEKEWITLYGRKNLKNGRLVNMTDGGEGSSNIVVCGETRKKLSERMKGNKYSQGFKQSQCTVNKRREKMLGRKYSPEHCLKLSIANSGKKCSDATKEKLRICNTGKKHHTPDSLSKMRETKIANCKIKGILTGATFNKKTKKWVATIRVGGIKKQLGSYLTQQEAHERYLLEVEKLND